MSDDGKDEEFERESKDGNTGLSPEGESRNESEEAEEHRLDHLLIGQLAEVQSSAFQRESNLPSVTDEAPPPVGDSNCEEDCGPAGEGGVREAPLAQFAERAVEIGLSGTVGIAKFADLSLDRQPPHKEDDTVPSLDEDTNSTILHGDVTAVVLAEEHVDRVPSHLQQDGTLSLADESFVVVQPTAQNVDVTFSVHYVTQSPYQTVAIMGNQQELGNWKGFVPLENAKDGHWVTVVSLPAESYVEWKFVVVDKGEVCRWEECGNRLLDTGSGDELMVHKCWARL
uniref:Starch-binding domain-containing protein 1 n=1 Tax=Cyclopterus lumpus TaxID=8103 RepID=A0A8C3AB00_CYCLU